MTDVRAVKRLAIVRAHLRRAAALLPEESRLQMEAITGRGEAVIVRDVPEPELAVLLDQLEQLGRLHSSRGGYWRSLERAAGHLGLAEVKERLHREYRR